MGNPHLVKHVEYVRQGEAGVQKKYRLQIGSIYSRLLFFNIILIVIATVLPQLVMAQYFAGKYKEKLEEMHLQNIRHVRDYTDETVFEQVAGVFGAHFSDRPGNDILIAPVYKDISMDTYMLLQISQKLEEIQESYPFISSVDVYYPASNILFLGRNVFFTDDNNWQNRLRKQWQKELITSQERLVWQPVSDEEIGCAYMRSIPYFTSENENKANILIEVSKKELQNTMMDARGSQDTIYALLSDQGDIICGIQMEKLDFTLRQDVLKQWGELSGSGYFTFRDHKKEYMISYAGSRFNNWKYISLTLVDDVFSGVSEIQRWILCLAALFVCLNVVFAVVMTKRAHAPMEYMINNISVYMEGDESDEEKKTQYQLIEKSFHSLQFQVDSLKENLEENRPLIYNNMIKNILNPQNQDIYRYSEILGFRKKYFSSFVAVIYYDRCMDIRSKIMIGHHVNDQLNQIRLWYDIYSVTDENELIYGVINFNSEEELQAANEELEQQIRKMLSVPFTLCYGNVVDDEKKIAVSYKEAEAARNHAFFYPKNQRICYSDLKEREKADNKAADKGERLTEKARKAIKMEDWEQFRRVTNMMLKFVMSNENTVEYRMNTLMDYIFSVRKGIVGNGYNDEVLFGGDIREQLKTINHISDVGEWLDWIVGQIETVGMGRKKEEIVDLKTQIEEYAAANIFNELSLAKMSDDLCISSSYLSRIFKSVMGTNCSEYLVNVKLDKARELLNTTDYTVKEISEKLGYASISHFNKIFKAHFGCTPKQCKKKV